MAVINGSQGATALVDIADFVVGGQVLVGHEWWLYVETAADVRGVRDARGRSRSGADEGARSACLGSPGGAGVAQAAVALPGFGL